MCFSGKCPWERYPSGECVGGIGKPGAWCAEESEDDNESEQDTEE